MTREHPFVQVLFGEVLKRLRPLVEEERKRAESERSRIENDATRRRLNALERAATKFIEDAEVDEEPARDPNDDQMGGGFKAKGFSLNPPFAQMIKGHSQRFWLNVSRDAFPEIETGAVVQVECLSPDISTDHRIVGLDAHPERENVLRAVWLVKAGAATPASAVRARVGPIVAESAVEVLNDEAERYSYVKGLEFERDRYLVRAGVKKKMRVLAPLALVPVETRAAVATSSKGLATRDEAVL